MKSNPAPACNLDEAVKTVALCDAILEGLQGRSTESECQRLTRGVSFFHPVAKSCRKPESETDEEN